MTSGSKWPQLRRAALAFFGLSVCMAHGAQAAEPAPEGSSDAAFAAGAAAVLAEYIKVRTINPPGDETLGVEFLAKIFDAAGIAYETAESAPGRGNIWARLKGGRKPGLVLLHHMDVVPADEAYWTEDPFGGVVKDGYVHGRGALDMKSLGVAQLQAFLALAASNARLSRDVWFVATADEEAGGAFGAGFMAREHPEVFKNVGFLLNEGGGGRLYGDATVFNVEVTQKVPLWLRLTATGRPGHGSSPQLETAVTRLLRAGHRIATTDFPVQVIEPVKRMFAGNAAYETSPRKEAYQDIEAAAGDVEFLRRLQLDNPGAHALLRNTCSLTRLEGSSKINVVPPSASLELDCRLLPVQDPEAFVESLTTIINDSNVELTKIMNFTPAVSSIDTPLFKLIESMTAERYPGSTVVPSVSTGFTDSHFFRDLGIVAYGFGPFVTRLEEFRGVHGNDERIEVANLEQGTAFLIELLRRFAG